MTLSRREFVVASGLATMGLAVSSRLVRAGSVRRADDALVITNVSLFDARTLQYRRAQSLLVRGDRIAAIGPAASFAVPEGAQVIDGTGKYLIPGLIDAHVHITEYLGRSGLTSEEFLPLFLRQGVTTVRSLADIPERQQELRRAATAAPGRYPLLFSGSPMIDGESPLYPEFTEILTDPAAVRPFVARMKALEVDTLKIYVGLNREIGKRVIAEGHAQGMRVVGHLRKYHPLEAVADGIDSLEHILSVADFAREVPEDRYSFRLESAATQRLIEALVRHGTAVTPTLVVVWGTLFFPDDPAVRDHPEHDVVPERLRAWWRAENARRGVPAGAVPMARRRQTFADYQTLVGMLHRAGVPILVGTDTPNAQVGPGVSVHREMELLVGSGMRPAEVLAAATLGNARALGGDDRFGTIEPGRVADLVMLDGDPLLDIRETRRIRAVVRSGELQ